MPDRSSTSQPLPLRLSFHRNSFFELAGPNRTLYFDPVLSLRRRGRRVESDLPESDYIFASSAGPWFDDTLDLLDQGESVLVASPDICRLAQNDLGLGRRRLLDLQAWERASEDGFRVTAFPIQCVLGIEEAIQEGEAVAQDLSGIFPSSLRRIPFLGGGLPVLDGALRTGMRTFEGIAGTRPFREVGRLGAEFGRIVPGRPGLGWFIEWEGYPSVLHLADGIHGGTPERDLQEIASNCKPDVLVAQVDGMDLQPIVRAARILTPETIILYRSRDPYASARQGRTLPIRSFVEALAEGAPDVEVVVLQPGDSFVLDPIELELAASEETAEEPRP